LRRFQPFARLAGQVWKPGLQDFEFTISLSVVNEPLLPPTSKGSIENKGSGEPDFGGIPNFFGTYS
jgi:hypothetical protein